MRNERPSIVVWLLSPWMRAHVQLILLWPTFRQSWLARRSMIFGMLTANSLGAENT